MTRGQVRATGVACIAVIAFAAGSTAAHAGDPIPGVDVKLGKNPPPPPPPIQWPVPVVSTRTVKSAVAGSTVTIPGQVTQSGHRVSWGKVLRITLQGRRADGRWRVLAGPARVTSTGSFALRWHVPASGGRYQLRLGVIYAGSTVRVSAAKTVSIAKAISIPGGVSGQLPGGRPMLPVVPAAPPPPPAPPPTVAPVTTPAPIDTGPFTVALTTSVCRTAGTAESAAGFAVTAHGATTTVRPGGTALVVLTGAGVGTPKPITVPVLSDGSFTATTTVPSARTYHWAATVTAPDGTQESAVLDAVAADSAAACT